jgi:hypothetical protein
MARDPEAGTSGGHDNAALPGVAAPEETPDAPADGPLAETIENGEVPASERRIAFERLRERTDELELIVSGLLAFALLALPSWLFDGWASSSAHAEGIWQMALMFGFMLGSGLCYTLAGAFMIHLAVRGYWVGLIGLKATFPKGIRWDSISTVGPISRDYYRARLPDLLSVIDRADRTASVLFAMATLIALMLLWSSVIIGVVALAGGVVGWLVGAVERVAVLGFFVFYLALMLVGVFIAVADAFFARRNPALQQSPRLRRWVNGMLRTYGMIMPQRLILPVQLTLQSNVSGKVFLVGFFVVMLVSPIVGIGHVVMSREFSLAGGYLALDRDAIEYGQASAHYEDMRGANDRLLRFPMIPSDQIAAAHLRLFLPHMPERDNPVLLKRCPALVASEPPPPPEQAAAARVACVAALWTITLDGQAVEVAGFLATERRDLGLRGLQGYLPMAGLTPGRHDLLAVWNADGPEDGRERRREYRVPFWFSPAFEQSLD